MGMRCWVNFYYDSIETTVTDNPYEVQWWIGMTERIHRYRLHKLVVGLDLEWRPNFPGDGNTVPNPVAVIQLCVGRRCLIFQVLRAVFVPTALRDFLNNPKYTFVGVGIGGDAMKLEKDRGLKLSNVVDVRENAAKRFRDARIHGLDLKGLGVAILGKLLPKPRVVTLSAWDVERLAPCHIEYACLDAFVSFELGRVLRASVN